MYKRQVCVCVRVQGAYVTVGCVCVRIQGACVTVGWVRACVRACVRARAFLGLQKIGLDYTHREEEATVAQLVRILRQYKSFANVSVSTIFRSCLS